MWESIISMYKSKLMTFMYQVYKSELRDNIIRLFSSSNCCYDLRNSIKFEVPRFNPECQLSVKISAICQLSVKWLLMINYEIYLYIFVSKFNFIEIWKYNKIHWHWPGYIIYYKLDKYEEIRRYISIYILYAYHYLAV